MEFNRNEFGVKLILTSDEQCAWYEKNLNDILNPLHTRYILDNLEFFPTYECNFIDYSTHTGNKKKFKKNPLHKPSVMELPSYNFNYTAWLYR